MSLLSPRFFALPLIALTVIFHLQRPSATDAPIVAVRLAAMKAVTCGEPPASCVMAASTVR